MWNHGTSDLLYINQNILKEAKKRKKNDKHYVKDKPYTATLNDRMLDFKEKQGTIINKGYGKLEKWTSLQEDGSWQRQKEKELSSKVTKYIHYHSSY